MANHVIRDMDRYLMNEIFACVLDEDDRRELSRTHPKFRSFYRFDGKYKFRYHIQGNSWKLLSRGLNNLLHRPKQQKLKFKLGPIPEEVKLSKFDFRSSFDMKYRSFLSVIQNVVDEVTKDTKKVELHSKNVKKVKFEPKPGPLEHVKKLTLSDCVLTLRSLHYLCKLFPKIECLEIYRCGMWTSAFSEPRPQWKLKNLTISVPILASGEGGIKKIIEFIHPSSGIEISCEECKISPRRPVFRRIITDIRKDAIAKHKKGKRTPLDNKSSSDEPQQEQQTKITAKAVRTEGLNDLRSALESNQIFVKSGRSITHPF